MYKVEVARAVHKHSPSHGCVRTASSSESGSSKTCKWFVHETRIDHHIVAVTVLLPVQQIELYDSSGFSNTPRETHCCVRTASATPSKLISMIQAARAVHRHIPSHCCVRTVSPSQAKRFKQYKVLEQDTNIFHPFVAAAPLPPAKQSDFSDLNGFRNTPT